MTTNPVEAIREPITAIVDRLLQDAIALDIRLGDQEARQQVAQADILKAIEHLRNVYFRAGVKW